jgi:DNA-binding NarL/FixJ family response regulator
VAEGGAYMTPGIARKIFNSFQEPRNHFEKLTDRERDVTNGILEGLSYKMIASKYDLSIDTVRMNIKSIYKKLKINSKGELFNLAKK